jgi:hypothetical protein
MKIAARLCANDRSTENFAISSAFSNWATQVNWLANELLRVCHRRRNQIYHETIASVAHFSLSPFRYFFSHSALATGDELIDEPSGDHFH